MQPLRERRRPRPLASPHDPHHEKRPGFVSAIAAIAPRLQLLYALLALQTIIIVILIVIIFVTTSRNITVNSAAIAPPAVALAASRPDAPSAPHPSASSSQPNVAHDFFVTIYAYNRPRHLLNLLRDIAREADAANLRVGVNILDDNSYGCDFPPVARNIFSATAGDQQQKDQSDTDRFPDVSPLLVSVPLPSTLPCVASHRFASVEAFAHARGWKIYVSKYRHARRRYWHLVRLAHGLLRPISSRFHLFLPDDDRLARDFFPSVRARWDSIRDARKLTLMLHVEATRETAPVWTDVRPRSVGDGVSRIGWVESGNFLCTPEYLRFLNFSFPHISPRRWIDNPPISSGVGATLSALIHAAHRRMFRTDRSHVAHVGVTLSQMNAQFRDPNTPALLTRHFLDGDDAYQRLLADAFTVSASIASHWVRETALHSAVRSLAPQVDHLYVYLNEYDGVPPFLNAPYITVARSGPGPASPDIWGSGNGGVIGDVGKFFWCNNLTTEFHVTADDDIVYPADYVERLHAAWRSFEAPVVVGVHGIRIKAERLKPAGGGRGVGYYGSRDVWMGVERLEKAVTVHIIGTGTMMYRVQDVGRIAIKEVFPTANMADVWFGLLAQKLRLPMVVIPREADWLREVAGTFEDSIYKRSTRSRLSERRQTEAARSIEKWELHEPKLRAS